MKIKVTFKDPEAWGCAMVDTLANAGLVGSQDLEAREELEHKFYAAMRQWVRYNEYVDLEIDTEAGTCTVKRVK